MMMTYWCDNRDPAGRYTTHFNYRNKPLYETKADVKIGSPSESQWLVPGTFDEDGNHIYAGKNW